MLPTEFKPRQKWFRIIDSNQVYRKRSLACGSHWHNEIEIVVMRKGQSNAFVNSQAYPINDDSLFVVFPGQIHSYVDHHKNDQDYYVLIFSPYFIPQFEEKFNNLIPQAPLLNGLSDYSFLSSILDIIHNIAFADPIENMETIQGLLYAFFGELRHHMSFTENKKETNTTSEKIIHYCSLHYKEDISLVKLAKDLDLSPPYVSQLFVNKLKVNFGLYIQLLRVSEAQRLLIETDMPIKEIAEAVGFYCVRTFDRAFAKIAGISPTKYRKQK